jgi:hypothetical protein
VGVCSPLPLPLCSREDVLREMRKEHTISNRIARRNFPSVMRGAQQERQEPS